MVTYTCQRCNYTTNHRTKFTRHQNRKNKCQIVSKNETVTNITYRNPLGNPDDPNRVIRQGNPDDPNRVIRKVIRTYPKTGQNIPQTSSFEKKNNEKYVCRYCSEIFTKKQNRWRHEKYRCNLNANKEETNKNRMLKVLPYKNTNRTFLTDDMISLCMLKQNRCVPEMIKLVHFSDIHPENMNILIRNLNNKYAVVYNGKEWIFFNEDDLLEKIIKDNQNIMHKKFLEWYDDANLSEKYQQAIKKFEQYLNVSSNQHLIDSIKQELKLLCYNIKNKIDIKNTGYIVTEVIE
jgi:hypothetical protein